MKSYVKTFFLPFRYLKKYPMFYVGLGLRSIYYILENLTPIIFGLLINELQKAGKLSWNDILLTASAYIAIKLFAPFIEIISGYIHWTRSKRVYFDYRFEILNMLNKAKPSYWSTRSKGEVQSAINSAADGLRQHTAQLSASYLQLIINIFFIVVTSLVINPLVLIFLILNVLVFILNIRFNTTKEKHFSVFEQKANEKSSGRINEFFNNFITIIYLNVFDREFAQIKEYDEKAYQGYRKRAEISIFHKWLTNNIANGILEAGILIILINDVFSGRILVGSLVIIVLFIQKALTLFSWVLELISNFVVTQVSVERVEELVIEPLKRQKDIPSNQIFRSFSYLQATKLSTNGEDENRLNSISFTIQKHQKVAIVGTSGGGKSSLIDVILKEIPEYGGSLRINDKEYHTLSMNDISMLFSIVPQYVQLFHTTLRDNIMLDQVLSDQEIQKVIHVTSLTQFVEKQSKGLDMIINESNTNLSGGERQRIGIARSLIQNNPVLILDEATASLDPQTEHDIISGIIQKYPEKTLLFISHKYNLLDKFDHILVMNEGSLIEQGSFDELIAKNGMFKELYSIAKK
jgi:ABC-type bacteriocin/lantibiotic exporter with double-glycine peptidase domain